MMGLMGGWLQSAMVGVLGAGDAKSHVLPHGLLPIFENWNLAVPIGSPLRSFWFTNHLLMTLVSAVVMLLVFVPMGRRYASLTSGRAISDSVPRGFVNMVEGMMDALRTGVCRPVLHENTDRFMPFLWTVFFFILFNNLLGMIPLSAIFEIAFGWEHVAGTATGNINVTGGLALCALFMIHFSGVREVFVALRAGTHGHGHGHGDEGHGAHHANGTVLPLAMIAAPGIYLYNFAPHAFQVEGRHGKPSAGVRVVMLVVFPAMMYFIHQALFNLLGGPDAGAFMRCVGLGLGVVYSLNGGGLHPLDLADGALWTCLFVLECIGAAVKPFALCMRLFANMVAGHTVLASILLLVPVFKGLTAGYLTGAVSVTLGCVLLSCLELFVAFLQAYIFMFLTTMFIGAAVHPEH
ncbi:MAG: F0F1 ATP synthase subunit A [Phycisphaerales bacterium]|nr:F0F1 ATP synthase subunit A [Phycisphaerales bacterium]